MNIVQRRMPGVLVTRPTEQAEGLCRRIEALGWRAIRFPAMDIRPLRDAGPWCEGDYDLLLFISKNAVRHGLPLIEGTGRARIAAVGKGTAAELERQGRRADLIPVSHDSEGLLALDALQAMEGKRILIVRGQGGRALLGDELRSRGARVEYAEAYCRCLPQIDPLPLIRAWREQVDLVLATSNEVIDNLFTLLGNDGRDRLQKTPWITVSERGLSHARAKGCAEVILAQGADDEALVWAMLRWAEGANL